MARCHTERPAKKTVYVLGAGFARDAGFPLQAEILSQIMDVDFGTLVDAPIYYTEFTMARQRVQDFLAKVFPGRNPPALEDVFTLLDETIARRQRCQSFSWQTLDGIREDLKHTILFLLQLATERYLRDTAGASDFYRRLAGRGKRLGCE
jgi:hypothetical protein